MSDKTRALLGLVLIIAALFFGGNPNVPPEPKPPKPEPNIPIINIDKPSEEIISVTKPVADLVTDANDRLRLCCFNKVFSDRIQNYPAIKGQQTNDLYVRAAKNYFGDDLQGKYDGFSAGVTGFFKRDIGTKNNPLSDEQKAALSKTFSGFAWCLNN